MSQAGHNPARLQAFLWTARAAGRLPHFRGRTRLLLSLYRALGLAGRHLLVETWLRRPAPYRVTLDLHSWLQRLALLTGGYEAEAVSFLARLHATLGRGYILDVGANVGLLSIPLALLTGEQVVAVEAVPDNVLALRRNIALNELGSRVAVVPLGLGDQPATVDIQVEGDLAAGEGTGTASILAAGSTYECVRQRIEVETTDALWRAGTIPRGCSIVKLDTDGYDLHVLRGARAFLGEERPVIFGEFMAPCLAWHGLSVADVIAFATEAGYAAWGRSGDGFSARIDPATFQQDLLLVPDELAGKLAWCRDDQRPRKT